MKALPVDWRSTWRRCVAGRSVQSFSITCRTVFVKDASSVRLGQTHVDCCIDCLSRGFCPNLYITIAFARLLATVARLGRRLGCRATTCSHAMHTRTNERAKELSPTFRPCLSAHFRRLLHRKCFVIGFQLRASLDSLSGRYLGWREVGGGTGAMMDVYEVNGVSNGHALNCQRQLPVDLVQQVKRTIARSLLDMSTCCFVSSDRNVLLLSSFVAFDRNELIAIYDTRRCVRVALV
jgi:hypothetical protein